MAFIRLLSGFVMHCPVNFNQVSPKAAFSHEFSNFNPLVQQKVLSVLSGGLNSLSDHIL